MHAGRHVLLLVSALVFLSSSAAGESRGVRIEVKNADGQVVGLYKESHALLIGVSDYTAGWPDIESVPTELAKVQRALKEHGFNVVRHLNPNARELEGAFEDFIDSYGYRPENRLLFFFSGHGYTRKEGSKGYLVPADAPNPDDDEHGFLQKALPMDQILSWSRQLEAKHALFLFDSCFSGTIFKARALPKRPSHISRATSLPVRQYITAGSAGEEVPAKSVFTPALVDALIYGWGDMTNDGYITGMELGLYLQGRVPQYAHQSPQFGTIRDYELSRGDFVFVVGGPEDVPGPAAAHQTGRLEVKTHPADASVWVEGKQRGRAPITLSNLTPGRLKVRARKEGYEAVEESVWVRAGKAAKITLILKPVAPTGSLSINSTPAGAKWYLDGAYVGMTPDDMRGVAADTHQIEVIKPGFEIWTESVTVKVGKMVRLDARLAVEKVEYALTVQTEPADAQVRILNIRPKYYPGIRLQPGRYHIEVSKRGYPTHEESIEIAKADRMVTVTLEKEAKQLKPGQAFRDRLRDGSLGPEMVMIPAGSFRMGDIQGSGDANERPVHWVRIGQPFALGKYEVTFDEYDRFAQVTGRAIPDDQGWGRGNPVINVSWDDAKAYAKWLSLMTGNDYRLPTEAEWEYAARAGTETMYPWGNAIGKNQANCDGCGSQWDNKQTAPAGSFPPNAFGIHDTSGNAWEWIEDCWNDSYKGAPANGSAWRQGDCRRRVRRGGSWGDVPWGLRSALRVRNDSGLRFDYIGFRVARALAATASVQH